ncbi:MULTISPECIES: D-alanyl-D-alanine carboxypeptidase family protein [Devosia]|mgnify:CR=1 FL=1|uniref:D-alanyl-D-alanine carboxypeptidase n=1 Tax=Devosia litorisediminis TaxID=2829817 RepID=A0A942I694_9HYPH|nr:MULTISPECIES: D-alanyl-D-alanine carboxypeptidase family protein [Devosia]MBS3850056.1 D-alanyl-D-alanine carboxypeptidase [Devosia litorisediminis]MCZ4347543.1 D-alanyl-D-alanine carboxypeptidase [Devosia neptuniae]
MSIVRRLALVALLALLSLGRAHANPMLLVDMDTLEVLYAQEAGQPWHPASLTKMMSAYVTFEEIAKGNMTLDTPVVLSKKAAGQAPSKTSLPAGSGLTLKDALYIMVVKSANDVSMAIAETVGGSEAGFVAKMNDAAARMGLTATHFTNPNGLHDPDQYTSARDLAVLALYIRQSFPQYLPLFGTDVVRLGKANLESNNSLLTSFAGTTGMKTGFVCASGLNMVATVERNGRNLMAIVLGGSSARERNERAAELILRGFSGAVRSTGQQVLTLANNPGVPPVDMRAQICGKEAKAYVAAQEAAFPMGLTGQPSYLNDVVPPRSYVATDLGRIAVGVSLPRPRPAHLPQFAAPVSAEAVAGDLRPSLAAAATNAAPFPRPRPNNL